MPGGAAPAGALPGAGDAVPGCCAEPTLCVYSSITLRTYAHLIPRPDRDVSSLDRTITQLGGSPSG